MLHASANGKMLDGEEDLKHYDFRFSVLNYVQRKSLYCNVCVKRHVPYGHNPIDSLGNYRDIFPQLPAPRYIWACSFAGCSFIEIPVGPDPVEALAQIGLMAGSPHSPSKFTTSSDIDSMCYIKLKLRKTGVAFDFELMEDALRMRLYGNISVEKTWKVCISEIEFAYYLSEAHIRFILHVLFSPMTS